MNRRADIIIYIISFLLLVGAASLWWRGIIPSSSNELVLLPGGQIPTGGNSVAGESNHHGSNASRQAVQSQKGYAGADHESQRGSMVDSENPWGSHGLMGDRAEEDNGNVIFVHVAGAVESPGVYRLRQGQRVYEALELAVPLEDADLDFLNLAGMLYDQDKIYVPGKGEFSGSHGAGMVAGGSGQAPGYGSGGSGSGLGSGSGSGSTGVSFPININTATAGELEALPGIGPAKAVAIVEFRRQRGPFTRKEDLKKVPGIGDVTYSKIEPLVIIR